MKSLLAILLSLLLLNCEIKKNPLAPNGPFGFFNLFYNLSKIGEWNYTDNSILFYSINDQVYTNSPQISFPATANKFTISDSLPSGLNFNSSNGFISGAPTSETVEKEYFFTANQTPFPDRAENKSSLKINTGFYDLTNGINIPISMQYPFPEGFTYTNYSITPSLPTGYTLNSTAGIISSTPKTQIANLGNYKISATRSDGNRVVGYGKINITEWVNEAYLKAPNVTTTPQFGTSVSISGDTIVVGSNTEDSSQTTITNGTTSAGFGLNNSGAAYVFKRTGSTWINEAYLKAPNAGSADFFGVAVSISGDTILVGANSEDSNQTTITNGTTAYTDNSASGSGAAYIFKRTGNTWGNEAYLKAPNAGNTDSFGSTVSISGDTILVGSFSEDSDQTTITNGTTANTDNSASGSGAAYIFKRTGTIWANEAYLKAPNAEANDSFGVSISISGDTVVVGATGESSNQTTITNGTTASGDNTASNSGAVYVFKRTGNTWANEAYLKAPNAETNDNFGFSVSISGNTIVVGARGEDSNQTTITNGTLVQASDTASDLSVGAAYIFRRTGTMWANEAYLKAPNAEGGTLGTGDLFGISVSISGNTIVVGAANEDSLQTTITNGNLVQVSDQVNDLSVGSAYVFKRSGKTWVYEGYLKAPNAGGGTSGAGDQFGRSVSISGDTIVVGSYLEDSNQTTITNGTTASVDDTANDSGAVYVFRRK